MRNFFRLPVLPDQSPNRTFELSVEMARQTSRPRGNGFD